MPVVVGVGNDPHSLPTMGGADVMSSEHTPSRIEPHCGKVFEDSDKSASTQVRGVFDKNVRRLNFVDDAGEMRPESALRAFDTPTLAGGADVLARESSRDDINVSTPRPSVEGPHIVPDRESLEYSVALPGKQDIAAVGINFNSANGAPSKEDPSKDAATCSGEQCELSKRWLRKCHIHHLPPYLTADIFSSRTFAPGILRME